MRAAYTGKPTAPTARQVDELAKRREQFLQYLGEVRRTAAGLRYVLWGDRCHGDAGPMPLYVSGFEHELREARMAGRRHHHLYLEAINRVCDLEHEVRRLKEQLEDKQ